MAKPSGAARERLLDQVTDHLLDAGVHDTTLRSIAAGAGTSHQLLQYHFGTREELLRAVFAKLRSSMIEDLHEIASRPGVQLVDVWRVMSDPHPKQVLLFRCMGLTMSDPGHFGIFAADVAHDWIAAATPVLERFGVSEREAESLATLLVATMRGLTLDLYATRDTARVEHAVTLLQDVLERRFPQERS